MSKLKTKHIRHQTRFTVKALTSLESFVSSSASELCWVNKSLLKLVLRALLVFYNDWKSYYITDTFKIIREFEGYVWYVYDHV